MNASGSAGRTKPASFCFQMGRKQKVGKQRRDKFYSLAKEVGYRSRAAFKLIQLNRSFRFLENSKICVDLCAAPGGWMQVAMKHMPVCSMLVGVDMFPIKPLGSSSTASSNVHTVQADITSSKCRMELDRLLCGNKVDLVLNDGAPNMGANWLLDAYTQNVLVLRSAEIASSLLRRGGWFVSKVFRSRDYLALQWVLKQLFGKVTMTKPQASRAESAEIFVVCSEFVAPDRIDPKFFNPKHVFGELETGEAGDAGGADKRVVTMDDVVVKASKWSKPNQDGYPEGKTVLFKKVSAVEFLRERTEDACLKMLMDGTEMVLDDPRLKPNGDVLHTMSDLKRMTKRDLRNLLKWRKNARGEIVDEKKEEEEERAAAEEAQTPVVEEKQEDVNSDDEINEILVKDASDRARDEKRRQRLLKKQKVKMTKGHEQVDLFDDVHGQDIDFNGEKILNALKKKGLRTTAGWFEQDTIKTLLDSKGDIDDIMIQDIYDDEGDEDGPEQKKKKTKTEGKKKEEKLNPLELAIGHALVQSKRSRELVIDEAYHRFAGYADDEGALPDWFVQDERKHCRKHRLPEAVVDPVILKEYQSRSKGVNVRSAKKVLEAKARKIRRDRKRLKKITAKVDDIPDDLETAERTRRITEIYKAHRKPMTRKRTQFVVAKKSGSLRVGGATKGGRVKLVDRRMKKDRRGKGETAARKGNRGKQTKKKVGKKHMRK